MRLVLVPFSRYLTLAQPAVNRNGIQRWGLILARNGHGHGKMPWLKTVLLGRCFPVFLRSLGLNFATFRSVVLNWGSWGAPLRVN